MTSVPWERGARNASGDRDKDDFRSVNDFCLTPNKNNIIISLLIPSGGCIYIFAILFNVQFNIFKKLEKRKSLNLQD